MAGAAHVRSKKGEDGAARTSDQKQALLLITSVFLWASEDSTPD